MRVLLLCVLALLIGSPALATRVHVDDSATGAADGSSKVDAFTTIQAAVTAAADADTVWIWPGSYIESVTMGSSDDNFTIMGVADSVRTDVQWTPDGTTSEVDGECVIYKAGTNLTVKNVAMYTTGTTNHNGIFYEVNSPLTVVDVDFTQFRVAIAEGSTLPSGADLTVRGCNFSGTQIAQGGSPVFFSTGIDIFGDGANLIENCTFDYSPVSTPSWTQVIAFRSVTDSITIRGCDFTTDGLGGGGTTRQFIRGDDDLVNVLIEDCTFSIGGEEAHAIKLGTAAAAADYVRESIVRNNRITFNITAASGEGPVGIFIPSNTSTDGTNANRGIQISGNTISYASNAAYEASGILVQGSAYVNIFNNVIRGYSNSNDGAIQLKSVRHSKVIGNQIYDGDNGVTIIGTNIISSYGHQYGCEISYNYFQGDGDDGAIKVDNSTGAASAPNDTLLTIGPNFFVDVADIADWVVYSGGDVQTSFADLDDIYGNFPAVSTLDMGEFRGSGVTKAAWKAATGAGGGSNQLGVSGKGLIK